MIRINIARIFNWAIIGFVILTNLHLAYWKDNERIIAHDVIEYYGYLPAAFIYHDLSLKFTDTVSSDVKVWYHEAPNGGRVLKMSMGLSALYTPFFLTGHALAKLFGYPANGYSSPYRFALIIAAVFYLGCALYFLRHTLSRYFSQWIVVLTCIFVTLGTNLFYYTTSEPAMSHVFSFFLFAAFIWFAIQWHEKQNMQNTLRLGFLAGLIMLVRPTNILILFFWLLYGVKNLTDLKGRVRLFFTQYRALLLMGLCVMAVFIPQLLYWKMNTGQWLYYSYRDEHFFFSQPKIADGLFSYRKGWLIYTPFMGLALVGIFKLLQKQYSYLFLPVIVFTVLNVYVILSWWCWWYGGSFGLRAFIESYALLALPLAACTAWMLKGSRLKKFWSMFFMLGLVILNQFQSAQYRSGAIHWDAMSKENYWENFGKLHPVQNFENMLEPPDYENAKKGFR